MNDVTLTGLLKWWKLVLAIGVELSLSLQNKVEADRSAGEALQVGVLAAGAFCVSQMWRKM
jgi:hypothetical protein